MIVIVRAIVRNGEALHVIVLISRAVVNQAHPTGRGELDLVNSSSRATPACFDSIQVNKLQVGDVKFSLTVSTNGNLLLNIRTTIGIATFIVISRISRLITVHKNTKLNTGCTFDVNLLCAGQVGIPLVIDIAITIDQRAFLEFFTQVVLTCKFLYLVFLAHIGLRRNRFRICQVTIPCPEHSGVQFNELISGIHTCCTQY